DEGCAPQTKAEDPFKSGAIHPSGRTGVPSPSAPPNMRRLRINIGADDVRFDLVAKNVGARSPMINRIQNGEQFAGLVSVPQHRKRDHGPNSAMSVLASIFPDARRISLNISGIERCLIEWWSKKEDQFIIAADELFVYRRHGSCRAILSRGAGDHSP